MKNTAYSRPTDFSKAVQADIKRSVFDRSSNKKTAFNASSLIPIYLDEVLPGDTFDMSLSAVSRLSTPVFPTMDNLNLDLYAFYCPNRLLWSGWEALNGDNKTGAWTPTTPPPLVPAFTFSTDIPFNVGSLGDYMDIPVNMPLTGQSVSHLPFRMYYRVWNEWFRDENLQAPLAMDYNSNSAYEFPLGSVRKEESICKVNKPHDYFTSCLPAPQKGSSVLLPVEFNELIPVITAGATVPGSTNYPLAWKKAEDGTIPTNMGALMWSPAVQSTNLQTLSAPVVDTNIVPANLYADATGMRISSSTISDLRTAFQLQKLYERDARGGTRYVEMLKAHFGVDVQDYRLQRSEFLGKLSLQMGIYQVAQTSSTDSTSPQGNMSAFGYASAKSHLFSKSFVEHGYVMIFAVARQRKTYQQGLDKMWSRRERFDFYYPALAHISEQPVYTREIYANVDKDEIFGYNEAWADYRYKPSKVSGLMRTGVSGSLSPYHYADYYASKPMLSADWIADNSIINLDNTLAVPSTTSGYQIILDIAFLLKATRPMPVYGVPGLVDHF